MPGDRTLEVDSSPDEAGREAGRIVLRAPDGSIELEIVVTEQGPVLRAASLAVEATDDLRLAAKRVSIEATERVDVRSEGKVRIDADGAIQSVGHSQEVRARAGNVELKANDDVRAQGERVRLNC